MNQKGIAHLLILFAAVGILTFILISNTFSFKNSLFSRLFPKPPSRAQFVVMPNGEDRCHNSSLPSVNVKTDFGAVGDGAANDSQAFFNAIATGKVIKIPAGTYMLALYSSDLYLVDDSTVVLCGAGQGQTIIKQLPSSTPGSMFYGSDPSGRIMNYFEIQNLTVDGNMSSIPQEIDGKGGITPGTITIRGREILIASNEFKNAYNALYITDVPDHKDGTAGEAIIHDNWFHNQALEALSSPGATTEPTGGGGTTYNIFVQKFAPSNSTIYVFNNNIEECASGTNETCTLPSVIPGRSSSGIFYDSAFNGVNTAADPPWQKLYIENNTLRNLGMDMPPADGNGGEPVGAIYIYRRADPLVITGNKIYNSYHSDIVEFSSNNVEIANNTITGSGSRVAPGTKVNGNTYSHTWYDGIGMHTDDRLGSPYFGGVNVSVHDNTIQNETTLNNGAYVIGFENDGSGGGVGSNVSVVNNTSTNNISTFDNGASSPCVLDSGQAPGVIKTPNSCNGATASSNASFKLTSAPTVSAGASFPVKVLIRSDTDFSNLFAAKLKFDPTKLKIASVSAQGFFITQWADQTFNNTAGTGSVVGGIPSPGYKTQGSDANFVTITFTAQPSSTGTSTISFDTNSSNPSGIFRNSDNQNILSQTTPTTITITPASYPTPTPTPTPSPSASPTPSASPSASPTSTPTPTPTPTPIPTPSPSPSPTFVPNPTACTISNLSWGGPNPVTNASQVSLNIAGSGTCNGVEVAIDVREDDGALGSKSVNTEPVHAFFVGSSTVGYWNSEFHSAPFPLMGSPGFFFTARIVGGSQGVVTASGAELSVNATGAPSYQNGDGDHDGNIDLKDLSLLLTSYGKTAQFPKELDLNNDGKINAIDYAGLLVILRQQGIIGPLPSSGGGSAF